MRWEQTRNAESCYAGLRDREIFSAIGNFRCSLISPKRSDNGLSSTCLPLPFEGRNFVADGTARFSRWRRKFEKSLPREIDPRSRGFLSRHSWRLVIILSITRLVSLLKFAFERSATSLEINLHILSQFAGRAATNLIWRPPQFSRCISYYSLITRA